MDTNTILMASLGGVLIGLASATLMLFNGRIAGISGIFRGVLVPQRGDLLWRGLFVLGLVAGGALMFALQPELFPTSFETSVPVTIAAGLLVGFGTRLGSGCTSGHGVCGLSRFSPRSLVATLTFITAGAVVVFAVRNLLG
jgi:uncharacterized membrane protein YedE/YeeE